MPHLSPIGYSVKTWSLSPYPTGFGQVEREPKPRLRIPSQWHCLMEVTARPGFHLFKTDPGYNDRVRPATETSRRRRAPRAGRVAPGGTMCGAPLAVCRPTSPASTTRSRVIGVAPAEIAIVHADRRDPGLF